ncbi:MAG: hypothetical protein Ta2F_18270 [Termitinemataceae bacterium]|nr:MAG: hypothetical protein Ta2F_18270 [Termitinemataceae bacterium]
MTVLFGTFFMVFHFFRGLGFGDVKYAAVIGYTLGFQNAIFACYTRTPVEIIRFLMLNY